MRSSKGYQARRRSRRPSGPWASAAGPRLELSDPMVRPRIPDRPLARSRPSPRYCFAATQRTASHSLIRSIQPSLGRCRVARTRRRISAARCASASSERLVAATWAMATPPTEGTDYLKTLNGSQVTITFLCDVKKDDPVNLTGQCATSGTHDGTVASSSTGWSQA